MTNREKYMKGIYNLIDSSTLANYIAVSKDGKICYCEGIERDDWDEEDIEAEAELQDIKCEDCKFFTENGWCDKYGIEQWLDSEVEEPKPIQVSDSDYNKYALWIPENEKWHIEHKLKDKGEKE